MKALIRGGSIAAACLTVALGFLMSLASATQANTPITSFSAMPSNAQAGGHPDIEVKFNVQGRLAQRSQSPCNCEDVKNATVHLPPGVIGNPHAAPQCSIADFSADQCPIDSQVGIAEARVSAANFIAAVYNLVPPPNVAGLAGFKIFLFDAPQFTELSARTGGDYGLDSTSTSTYHASGVSLESFTQDLWGVPASHAHDLLRLNPAGPEEHGEPDLYGELCDASGSNSTSDPNTVVQPCTSKVPPIESNSPLTPFTQNPTTCAAPLSSTLEVLSYDGGITHAESPWPQEEGCDQLGFNPSLYAQPTTKETDTPSGIDVNLLVPQQLSPTVPSPTELRGATVTLPPGFSINPNAADGKTFCTEEDAKLGAFSSLEEAECPEFAKVGSLEIESSALPGPLPGYIYLGQSIPGSRYRIFLVANGFATHVKLAGTVSADPSTGQLVIRFTELPQTTFTAIDMHFFGSERGLLATPTQCGTYPVTTTFTPWDETIGTQTSSQYFTLDSGPNGTACPGGTRPFDPGFEAASENNTAGSSSPFSIELMRVDGDQNLTGLVVTAPPGLSATLAGIPYCSDTAIATAASPATSGRDEEADPSCPATSQIGTAVSGAGAGDHPLYVSGKVYLAGSYKGAPLSLVVITPAISGPYDLGNVVVRAALQVNPETARVTAATDPLPQILEGIPLRLRSIRIDLNRKHFALNPTNCDPFSVAAKIDGNQGAQANAAQLFQVANCGSLPFEPKLTTRIAGSTSHGGNPALKTELTVPQSGPNANVSRVSVTLPHSELLDNAHIKSPCTRVQFSANQCPPGSLLGFARADTPLLEKPLEGPVYLRTNGGERKLPDIVAELKGQIDINLVGFVESVRGHLRTTFNTVPDAPVSRFTLNLDGGHKGLLINSINLCSATEQVNVQMTAQSEKTANQNPVLQTPCGKKHRRHLARAMVVRK
jgi:hypothetical protein